MLRYSLRSRVMAGVLAVVVAPIIFVWISDLVDANVGERMARRVEAAAAAVGQGEPVEDAARRGGLARRVEAAGLWIRHLDSAGEVIESHNLDRGGGLAGDFFFGPDGAPSLAEWDAGQPPLGARPEVVAARAGAAPGAPCAESARPRHVICAAATPTSGGGVIHVQESSRRAIRALYDVRYQLLKLSLFVLVCGVGLGAFIGWRLVLPIERLSQEVRLRAGGVRPTTPVPVDRPDEIGALAQDVNRLLAALEARNRGYERFVADLAHEFKNPVAAIRAAAESLERNAPEGDRRARRLSRVLKDSSGRLDALLSRLLELARVEAGLPEEGVTPLRLDALVENLCAATDARHEAVAFERELAPAEVEVVPERLETALRNVLENAAAFAAPRDGAGPWVRVTLAPDAGDWRITVADSGPGIAPADLPRIFDRFFTTRARGGGTGLGLALTRAVVEAGGGEIAAASPPGGGGVITIRLPALEA